MKIKENGMKNVDLRKNFDEIFDWYKWKNKYDQKTNITTK